MAIRVTRPVNNFPVNNFPVINFTGCLIVFIAVSLRAGGVSNTVCYWIDGRIG
jgi:hypothetical protein